MMRDIILRSLVLLVLFCYKGYFAISQTDTLRVMAYNVLNYGEYPLCQGPNGYYHAYLETIVQYAHPDVISLEKMGVVNITAATNFQDSILQFALNAAYPGRYNYCTFTDNSGANTFSMLFYNQQKLTFVGITCNYPSAEDFNTYKLYYNDPSLAATHDTTFLYVTVNHDISGSGYESERGIQIANEMAQIQTHFTHLANMINMGDFNVRNSSEPCYQTLTAPADTNFRYYDPPFMPDSILSYPADWEGNASFASYLTTSTRLSASIPNSCGTSGGAKDWYDHIFLSPWIVNNTNYIRYIPHSFRVLGNDGNRMNRSVNDMPANTSVPSVVADALFQMSNKYPVIIDLLVTQNTTGISPPDPEIISSAVINQSLQKEYATIVNPVESTISLHFSKGLVGQNVSFECIDMLGRTQIRQSVTVDNEITQIPCNLKAGVYIARIADGRDVICQTLITKY